MTAGQDQNKENEESSSVAWWQPALVVFGEITGWIVAPIVIALFLGQWLDRRYDTAPWFYLGCTAAAFIITMIGLVRVGTKYIKRIERNKQKDKPNDTSHKEP